MLRLFGLLGYLFLVIQFLNFHTYLMLAPSKVEISSSASPFGYGLRNQNWRERVNTSCRESSNNVETAFQTSIKYFLQDHQIHEGISNSTPQKNPEIAGDETKHSGTRKRNFSPNLLEDSTVDTQDPGCVSSLVQKWRKISDTRAIELKQSNPNPPSPSSSPCSSSESTDSGSAFQKSSNYHQDVSSVNPKNTCRSVGENFDSPCNETFDTSVATGDDMFCDTDSDGAQSCNSSCGETEKLRVVDVIKKLKLEKASKENVKITKIKEQEKKCASLGISSSPRIRGRQALNDLLMQLERDRRMELDKLVEHQAVSKFSHRGRIQSLLRLKSMRREAIVRNHHQQQISRVVAPTHSTPAAILRQPSSCEVSTIVDSSQISPPSSISGKQEQAFPKLVTKQNSYSEATKIDGQRSESLPSEPNHIDQGSTVMLLRKKSNAFDENDDAIPKSSRGVARSYIQCIKSSSSSSFNKSTKELHKQEVADIVQTSFSSQNSISKDAEISSPDSVLAISNEWELCKNQDEHVQNNSPSLTNYEPDNIGSPEFERMLTTSNEQEDYQNNKEWRDEQILGSGDEWRSSDIQSWGEWYDEDASNVNWVSDIARPKSDWENLRQERYRDMLDSDHENDEVRRLLERRSVSTFLTSNLRETMDQLMMSRVERVPQSRKDHDEHLLEEFVISQVQTQTDTRKEDEEIHTGGGETNFLNPVRFPSHEQPQSAQSSCPDTTSFSALSNRSSIDMDYMYDLRAYVEQLHREVSELRKTVNNCMNMQEKMQGSIKQEVATAISNTWQVSNNSIARTKSCCLCSEMQVDSLFYRCGHMCACFKCAHELHTSAGKCPICRAPIVDVVRVYPEVITLTGDEPNEPNYCADDIS